MDRHIRRAVPSDRDLIKRLTDSYISKDFYSPGDIRGMMEEKDHRVYIYETDEGEGVAYFYVFVSSLKEASEVLGIPEGMESLTGYDPEMRVGVYKTTVTEKAYRRGGILSAFLEGVEDDIKDMGGRMIYFVAACIHGNEIPVDTAVRNAGFVRKERMEKPWKHIFAHCPCCGKDYCECDGVIYTKDL